MKWNRSVISMLALVIIAAGCESVALMPRRDVDPNEVGRNQNDRDLAGDKRERDRTADEIAGSVQRVDAGRQEIELRTRDSGVAVVKYDSRTVVYNRARELPVEDLRPGDQVVVKFGNDSGYGRYADIIRMVDQRSDREY